jgi:hypothetical protein
MPRLVRISSLLTAVWLGATASVTSVAAQEPGTERKQPAEAGLHAANVRLRAMYLIAGFIHREPLPSNKPLAYRFAFVGADDVTAIADEKLAGKKVADAAVQVAKPAIGDAETGKTAGDYDLLYLASSIDAETRQRIIASHVGRPVVLICEAPGFARGGGGVQLFVKDNNIRFDVNVEALKKQSLRAATDLLKLAKKGPE